MELEMLMVDADWKRADMMSSRWQFGELCLTAFRCLDLGFHQFEVVILLCLWMFCYEIMRVLN